LKFIVIHFFCFQLLVKIAVLYKVSKNLFKSKKIHSNTISINSYKSFWSYR